MMIDEDVCRLLSAQEGLPLDFVVKEFYMMALFRDLLQKGIMGSMIFKGGTAINSIYLKEGYRFSEDLDFDFVGKDWPNAFKVLSSKSADFIAIEARRILNGNVVQIDFRYKTAWGKMDRIRIDVNIMPNVNTMEPVVPREISSPFGGFGAGNVQTYGLSDLLARKLMALNSRGEGKDIYDASNSFDLTSRQKLLRSIILLMKPRTKYQAIRFISETIEKLKSVDCKKVRNITNPYIPLKNRPPDWQIFIDTLIIKLEGLLKVAKSHRA